MNTPVLLLSIVLLLASSSCREHHEPTARGEPTVMSHGAPTQRWTAASGDTADTQDASDLVRVRDPAHVDPLELIAQARSIALRYDAHAVLTRITTHRPVEGGAVDMRSNVISYRFEFDYPDKTRRPGEDRVQGSVDVQADRARFNVLRVPVPLDLQEAGDAEAARIPDPKCSLQQAWQAAVRSGVPANALIRIDYMTLPRLWVDHIPDVWRLRVDNHPELTRHVSGATCALKEKKP